jgi:hypothetical protein
MVFYIDRGTEAVIGIYHPPPYSFFRCKIYIPFELDASIFKLLGKMRLVGLWFTTTLGK